MNVATFMPKPTLTKLTIVYDDVAVLCFEIAKELRENPTDKMPCVPYQARPSVIVGTLAHDVLRIAKDDVGMALHEKSEALMLEHGRRISDKSASILNVVAMYGKEPDIVPIAQRVFSLPPADTPDAPPISLAEKRAILHSFGARRLAALLA